MRMDDKLKPVQKWVIDQFHGDGDTSFIEKAAQAIKKFELDEEEALAFCERLGVQYIRVKRGY